MVFMFHVNGTIIMVILASAIGTQVLLEQLHTNFKMAKEWMKQAHGLSGNKYRQKQGCLVSAFCVFVQAVQI